MDKRKRRTGQRKRRKSGQRKRRKSGQRKRRRNSRRKRNGETTPLYILGGVVWNSVLNVVNS